MLKQTTLDLNRWNKRCRTDDTQHRDHPLQRTSSSSPRTSQDEVTGPKASQTCAVSLTTASTARIIPADTLSSPEIILPKASLSFTSDQLPLSSSSQRIVRNGERMVTNSDEDDDSSLLEDLDDLIRPKDPEGSNGSFKQAGDALRVGSKASPRVPSRSHSANSLPLEAKGTEYKYSLAVLAEQRRHLQNSGEDVAKVNAILQSRRHSQPVTEQNTRTNAPPCANVIDVLMNERGDEEDADRLKDALQRTEALHRDKTWSFFRASLEAQIASPPRFPDLEGSQLRPILHRQDSRQQAFLNGFVEDYATKIDLPDELELWILDSTYSEKREDLRLSYVHVLKELGLRKDELLTPQRIDDMFRNIGASDEALDMQKSVTPNFITFTHAGDFVQDHLIPVLGLINALAGTLKLDSSIHAICTLCRLLLDRLVAGNGSLVTSINETLNNLIDSIPDLLYKQVLYTALPIVYGSVYDPALRLQLLRNLPVYACRTAIFRRRLALAFFFHDADYLKKPEENLVVDLASIATYIQTSRFTIRKETDYAQLMASMAILDIGIDMGDPVLPLSTKKEEQEFDFAVDLLSRRLKEISAQIVGASALNMRRTEAKEILDAIQRRLKYTVRSRPPLNQSLLADPTADHAVERGRMTEYLEYAKSKAFGGSTVDLTNTNTEQTLMHE